MIIEDSLQIYHIENLCCFRPYHLGIQIIMNWKWLMVCIQRMLAIWSLVPLPFLKQAWTSGSSWFMYCWSLAWRILGITFLTVWDEWILRVSMWILSMWDECNCAFGHLQLVCLDMHVCTWYLYQDENKHIHYLQKFPLCECICVLGTFNMDLSFDIF